MKNPNFLNDTKTLTDIEKNALYHRFCQDKTLTEVGEALGISTKSAQLTILRALNKVVVATSEDATQGE